MRRSAPGQIHGWVMSADRAVPPAPGIRLQGHPEPQVLYLQPDSTTPVPLQTWYNRVENKLGRGTNPPRMVSNHNEALTNWFRTVDQVSRSGNPVSGFRACGAGHKAFPANPPRERFAQTGERGGNRV